MINKYNCKMVTGKDGHIRAECVCGEDDNYVIVPDFNHFLQGSLTIARQFGPNETDDENHRNTQMIVIQERNIIDNLKSFLSSTRKELVVGSGSVRKGLNINFRFTKESHGWLRAEETTEKLYVKPSTIYILVHKDVVPFMKQVIDENFT